MNKNSKGFIQIILVLIVVVLVGGGMYYFGKVSNKSEVVVEIPTEEPVVVATQKPSTDPTANWKVYNNISANYQIKYPSDWSIVNQSAGSLGNIVADSRYVEISLGEGKSGILGIEELGMIPPSEESNLNKTKVIGNITLRCNGNFTNDTKSWCWVKVPNHEKYLNIQIFKNTNESMNIALDQILSTFRFTQ